MTRVRSPIDELAEFLSRSATVFEERVLDVARAQVDERVDPDRARERLAGVLGQTMALADLYGRRRVFLELDAASREGFRFGTGHSWPATSYAATPLMPGLSFEEALRDLLSREPRLAPNGRLVANLYSTRHAFALAYSTERQVTERVQKALGKLIREGVTQAKGEQVVQKIGGWSRAYADTVYRTNLNTAYSAGRFQQAADPDVADLMPAFERFAVLDGDARPNHAAAHGLVASTRDPVWDTAATPSGYG